MQVNRQSTIIQEQPTALDAGLQSLRIDRSGKQSGQAPRGKLRWALLALGALALLGSAGFIYGRLNAATAVETVRVRASSTATSGNAGATILSATGYIIAAHKIALAAKVSGRVAWSGVEKGDRVKQGQPLNEVS